MAKLSVAYVVPVALVLYLRPYLDSPPPNVPITLFYHTFIMKAQRILGTPLSKIYLSSFALEEVREEIATRY